MSRYYRKKKTDNTDPDYQLIYVAIDSTLYGCVLNIG